MHGIYPRPILEVNATLREYFLHRLDEFVDERIEIISRRAGLAHTEVEGIVQVLFIVSARVKVHGEQILRRHPRAGGVQLQLANRDARSVGAKISEAEDAAAVRDADKPDIFLGPAPQNLLHFAAACHRQIHAARLTENMAELQAGFADGWVVNDRQK